VVHAPVNVTQHWNKHDFVAVDVSNVLFVCAGAFSDLDEGRTRRVHGFDGEPGAGPTDMPTRVGDEDFRRYGFSPEFLGRLPVRVGLGALSAAELKRVLVEPPDSVLKEYRTLLATEEVRLEWEEDAFDPVVAYAARKSLGARALRTVLEEALEEAMFTAPDLRGSRFVLTRRETQAAVARLGD